MGQRLSGLVEPGLRAWTAAVYAFPNRPYIVSR